ncbi:CI-like repressor [Companilactobacillus nodensis DSM 19682 = JCM 14932 = NBRC 107160]|uniref:CI-like repressor n=2 Tax=Companilactobacillus nodensis TaxID=460870 RepID=A0A0R1KFW1_9LACO|nr:CI-like repressor [Companilactobacillus nodensis DSM 19682 = JCM 14932 = NBRC 107160]
MTGVAKSSLSRYENKSRQFPLDQVSNFSKALSLSPEFVLGFNDNEDEIDNNSISKSNNYNYFDTGISAGMLMEVDPFTKDDVQQITLSDVIMGKYAGDQDIIVSHVNGESMNRILPDKSLIAIKKFHTIDDLRDGDIVVFQDGGDMSVKRFYFDDNSRIVTFSPDSYDSSFRPINYRYEDFGNVRIVGKVVVYTVEI